VVFHCYSLKQAEQLFCALARRLKSCGIAVHPDKTKIVYCKDSKRRLNYECISFDFLGFTFRPRKAKPRYGNIFTGFTPAISQSAQKRIGAEIRNCRLQFQSSYTLEAIAATLNPRIRGWLNYYRHFGRGRLYRIVLGLDGALVRWARRKFKRLKRSYRKSINYILRIKCQQPRLFAHWYMLKFG